MSRLFNSLQIRFNFKSFAYGVLIWSHCKFLKLKKKNPSESVCAVRNMYEIFPLSYNYIALLQCTISNLSIKLSSLIHSQRNNRGSYSQVSAF